MLLPSLYGRGRGLSCDTHSAIVGLCFQNRLTSICRSIAKSACRILNYLALATELINVKAFFYRGVFKSLIFVRLNEHLVSG